jgi:hypothetical protein
MWRDVCKKKSLYGLRDVDEKKLFPSMQAPAGRDICIEISGIERLLRSRWCPIVRSHAIGTNEALRDYGMSIEIIKNNQKAI